MTENQDNDPYAYGAVWHHDDDHDTVRLLAVFEDTDGLTGYRQEGEAFVVLATDTRTMPLVMTVSTFLALYSRADGSAPVPDPAVLAAHIPQQRDR